jgi:patatin-related protein
MNGGVSLAIWIGGVAHEINRFVGETHPVYRQLLELTSTRARVDVVSGTSAGGINGAALALSCVYDTSLYSLRDLWLTKGSFADLLRDPGVKDPPSLLDGDGYFLPALHDAFKELVAKQPRPKLRAPMDLALTATMLHAEPNHRLDDLGEVIEDCHHRASFHFSRADAVDAFADPEVLSQQLAEAARASASFPVAFEPRLFTKAAFNNAVTRKQASYDRYLIDGGVLDNKPLGAALKAVFSMPATRSVRRVLAYVVPDPAVNALAKSDAANKPPSIAEVAVASLLGIPSAQSIADHLQQIDDHNGEVRRRRHSFGWLAANISATDLESMANSLFNAYRERRIDGLLDYALEEVEKSVQLTGTNQDGLAFGRRTREWLKSLWRQTPGVEAIWTGLIPNLRNAWTFDLGAAPNNWNWGLHTVEGMCSVMLELLRRTQRLSHLSDARGQQVVAAPSVPVPEGAVDEHGIHNEDNIDWDLQDRLIRNQRRQTQLADEVPDNETELGRLWARAYALLDKVKALRIQGLDKQQALNLFQLLKDVQNAESKATDATRSQTGTQLLSWLSQFLAPSHGTESVQQAKVNLARDLAGILLDLQKPMQYLLCTAEKHLRPEENLALSELNRLYELLFVDELDTNGLVRRLLQLEVVHYAMIGHSETVDAAVELVQISGRGRSPWGGPDTPATKLTGMQLGHFGAFYRKSWRANDWMMGRLDGIDRIVRIALNPDRLHRLYSGREVQSGASQVSATEYVAKFIRSLAVDSAAPSHRKLLDEQWQSEEVRNELLFLENPAARAPDSLPLCAAALTRRLHLEVLCKELPILARSVEDDTALGAVAGTHGATLVSRARWDLSPWRKFSNRLQLARALMQRPVDVVARALLERGPPPSLMSPEAAVSAFKDCPVGSELLTQEFGSDLMTRTASQTIALAHAAAVGKRSGMAKVGDALKLLTLPIKFFYLLANRLTGDSRTSAAIATTMLVAGFLFVLGAGLLEKPPAGLALIGWSMLLGWFGTTLARQMRATAALTLAALAIIWMVATNNAGVTTVVAITLFAAALIWAPLWVGIALSAVAALWWSTKSPAPEDIAAAMCDGPLAFSHCHAIGTAEHATVFIGALEPMIVVFVLGIFAFLATRKRR